MFSGLQTSRRRGPHRARIIGDPAALGETLRVDGSRSIGNAPAMGDPAQRHRMTPEEYLAFERSSDVRHEYADGEIFAMSGGTIEHATVASNIVRELGTALRDRGCRVLGSDMRVKIPAGRYVYPDASVVCGRPHLDDTVRDTLTNPGVVVEVLSDSSEAYDRGDKFAHYRSVPSLMHYVLAPQKAPRIEVFTRQSQGGWLLRAYGPGETAALDAIGCELVIDDVYRGLFEVSAEQG